MTSEEKIDKLAELAKRMNRLVQQINLHIEGRVLEINDPDVNVQLARVEELRFISDIITAGLKKIKDEVL